MLKTPVLSPRIPSPLHSMVRAKSLFNKVFGPAESGKWHFGAIIGKGTRQSGKYTDHYYSRQALICAILCTETFLSLTLGGTCNNFATSLKLHASKATNPPIFLKTL